MFYLTEEHLQSWECCPCIGYLIIWTSDWSTRSACSCYSSMYMTFFMWLYVSLQIVLWVCTSCLGLSLKQIEFMKASLFIWPSFEERAVFLLWDKTDQSLKLGQWWSPGWLINTNRQFYRGPLMPIFGHVAPPIADNTAWEFADHIKQVETPADHQRWHHHDHHH